MRRIALEQVDSTNAEAHRLVAAGAIQGWTQIIAGEQLAGRGRHQRAWSSPPGNLYSTLIVPKDERAGWRRPWLAGFAVALALAEAIESALQDDAPVRVKWPNDVLVAGAKISGVLIEARGTAPFLVIGTGVNVLSHPPDTAYPATHINAHRAAPLELTSFAELVGERLRADIEHWLDQGFASVRARLLRWSHRSGDMLSVSANGQERTSGLFVDIDEEGCLCLQVEGKIQRFAAGDVFPGLT